MEIHFKTPHYKDTEQIPAQVIDLAEKKVSSLKKYLGKTEAPTQVYVELGKDSEAHANGNFWRATINLDNRGKRFNASASRETIQAAIDITVSELQTELRKAKGKQQALQKRGGGVLKLLTRGFKTL